jgi:hypothetical protein
VIAALVIAFTPLSAKIQFTPGDAPRTVFAVGDFDGWQVPGEKLTLADDGMTWQATIKLDPGFYRYVCLEDGRPLPTWSDLTDHIQTVSIPPADYSKEPGKLGDGIITQAAIRHRPERDVSKVNDRTFLVALRVRKDDVRTVIVSVSQPDHEQKFYAMTRTAGNALFDEFTEKIVVAPSVDFDYRFLLNDGNGPRTYDTGGLSQGAFGRGNPFHLSPATISPAKETDDPIAGKY